MIRMPLGKASGLLATLWLACFVLCLAIPALMLANESIEPSTFLAVADQTSSLYVPYLGTILGFYFVNRRRSGGRLVPQGPLLAAIVVSAIWNFVLLWLFLQAPLGRMGLEEAAEIAGSTGSKLAWLVAPAIGYFFAKEEKT